MNVSHARRYTLRERIGGGGFGEVWLGELQADGLGPRPVAIKLARSEYVVPDLEARLRDEARLLNLLRHRVIVRVEDLLSIDGRPALVMEYIDGVDLVEVTGLGPAPLRAVAGVGAEVAEALGAAHAATDPNTGEALGLIHRDVKPENIRIQADGSVKLLDFGIARARTPREARGTMAGVGTPGYLAPERHDMEVLPAGDVYSLGIVLAQVLSGTEPACVPVPLAKSEAWVAELSAGLPTPMRRLLREMTAREPGNRPSALACAARLREIAAAMPEEEDLHAWARRVVPPLRRPVVLRGEAPAVAGAAATLTLDRLGGSGRTAVPEAGEAPPSLLAPPAPPPVALPVRRSHTALAFGVMWSSLAGGMALVALVIGVSAWKGADAVAWLKAGFASSLVGADAAHPPAGPGGGGEASLAAGEAPGPGAPDPASEAHGPSVPGPAESTDDALPPTVQSAPASGGGDAAATDATATDMTAAAPGGVVPAAAPSPSPTTETVANTAAPTPPVSEGALATGDCGAVSLRLGDGASAALPTRWKVVDPQTGLEVSKTAMPCNASLVLSMDFGSVHRSTSFAPSTQREFVCQANSCVPRR